MVNQWGRDGNSASGNAGSSRSAGGFIIPVLIALIIGAGGGYAGARFLGGASASDIAARDKRIAELNKTLSDMKFDGQGANSQQSVLRQRVKDLEAQVQSLKKSAGQQSTKALQDAQAEIAALQKTIEEAGDLSGQLNRARKSQKVSELQIIELEKTVNDQKAEIGKLQNAVQKQADQANPALVLLQGQNKILESQLADAKKVAADVPVLKSRIAALEDQLAQRAEDADVEARQQIADLRKQNDDLRAKIAVLSNASGNVAQLTKKLADMQIQLDNAQTKLADRDAAVKQTAALLRAKTAELDALSKDTDQLKKKIGTLQAQLDEMTDKLADGDKAARSARDALKNARSDMAKSTAELRVLTDQNQALGKTVNDLRTQVATLNATIANLRAAKTPSDDKPVANDNQNDPKQNAGLTPRDRGDVEKAVADLPGYANLDADKQQTLVDMLEKGECVTDSLKAAFGHVSPISLRSLVRDLGGRC